MLSVVCITVRLLGPDVRVCGEMRYGEFGFETRFPLLDVGCSTRAYPLLELCAIYLCMGNGGAIRDSRTGDVGFPT